MIEIRKRAFYLFEIRKVTHDLCTVIELCAISIPLINYSKSFGKNYYYYIYLLFFFFDRIKFNIGIVNFRIGCINKLNFVFGVIIFFFQKHVGIHVRFFLILLKTKQKNESYIKYYIGYSNKIHSYT